MNTYKLAKEKELNLKINTKYNFYISLFEGKKGTIAKSKFFIFVLLIEKNVIYIIK